MLIREIFTETASAGSTSAGGVASVVSNKKTKTTTRKNKNGTVKNALDTNDNIFGNTVLKR